MSNTGNNFYSRFGDRLPTREVKSRRARVNVGTAKSINRGLSIGPSKNYDSNPI